MENKDIFTREEVIEMFYVTTEPIVIHGSYSELIDDGCPSIGTYSREHNIKVPANTGLTVSTNGKITHIDMEIILGVSMFEGTFTAYDKISKFDKAVKQITREKYALLIAENERYKKIKEKIDDLKEELWLEEMNLEGISDVIKESDSISVEKYNYLSTDLMNSALNWVSLYGQICYLQV